MLNEGKVVAVEKREGENCIRLNYPQSYNNYTRWGGTPEISSVIRALMVAESVASNILLKGNPLIGRMLGKSCVFVLAHSPIVEHEDKRYRVKSYASQADMPLNKLIERDNTDELEKLMRKVYNSCWEVIPLLNADTIFIRKYPDLNVFLFSEHDILKIGFNSFARFAANTPEFEVKPEEAE